MQQQFCVVLSPLSERAERRVRGALRGFNKRRHCVVKLVALSDRWYLELAVVQADGSAGREIMNVAELLAKSAAGVGA